ncbi:hypothetical protein AJ87_24135 [Rhizobium yanglingense]|nr:hypothetical protein AJ87_24135 [Rhizobium yanglingense]
MTGAHKAKTRALVGYEFKLPNEAYLRKQRREDRVALAGVDGLAVNLDDELLADNVWQSFEHLRSLFQ